VNIQEKQEFRAAAAVAAEAAAAEEAAAAVIVAADGVCNKNIQAILCAILLLHGIALT
jgi:hypothetical protein